jgi:hypothetical protein
MVTRYDGDRRVYLAIFFFRRYFSISFTCCIRLLLWAQLPIKGWTFEARFPLLGFDCVRSLFTVQYREQTQSTFFCYAIAWNALFPSAGDIDFGRATSITNRQIPGGTRPPLRRRCGSSQGWSRVLILRFSFCKQGFRGIRYTGLNRTDKPIINYCFNCTCTCGTRTMATEQSLLERTDFGHYILLQTPPAAHYSTRVRLRTKGTRYVTMF